MDPITTLWNPILLYGIHYVFKTNYALFVTYINLAMFIYTEF